MSKLCAMPGCEQAISRRIVMCPHHWRQVPADLQAAVHRTWQRILDRHTGEPLAVFREHMAAYKTAVQAAVEAVSKAAAA